MVLIRGSGKRQVPFYILEGDNDPKFAQNASQLGQGRVTYFTSESQGCQYLIGNIIN